VRKEYPDYIVVEGPIGVGKTSLAKRLADTFNTEIMLESVSDNPFLPGFYENPKASALPTQLYFLFQRAKQLEAFRQTDMFKQVQIADFLIEKDMLFAQVTLGNDEFDLYQQVYDRLTLEAPVPGMVIYLQAPVEVLLTRIIERGVDYEKRIDENYLKRITNAYIDNTIDFDLVNDAYSYNVLLEHMRNLPPGKHYFNPKEI
jgi:deoxyadenosine/deoxycytidine kinase